jgi:hypothetical protein
MIHTCSGSTWISPWVYMCECVCFVKCRNQNNLNYVFLMVIGLRHATRQKIAGWIKLAILTPTALLGLVWSAPGVL